MVGPSCYIPAPYDCLWRFGARQAHPQGQVLAQLSRRIFAVSPGTRTCHVCSNECLSSIVSNLGSPVLIVVL